MVVLRDRLFLVIDLQFLQRQRTIDAIKNKIFHNAALSLSTFTFYGKDINIDEFKEKVLTFSFERNKIILIKEAFLLPTQAKDFLFANFAKIIQSNYIILEIEKEYQQFKQDKKVIADTFFNFILKNAAIYKSDAVSGEVSFEDLKKMVRKNDLAAALYVLERLFAAKPKDELLGVQVLGWLVFQGSYANQPHQKQKYFNCLWEADRAMKENGLSPRLALEIALVKLLG
ncbi:MAG: hypothetical protein PHQ96_05030 [Candidatus Omnitrophica bacterium]|nr:hypothetical protein [Candidatus Omnitrophota bacterium]